MTNKKRSGFWISGLLFLTLLVLAASLILGDTSIGLKEFYRFLLSSLGLGPPLPAQEYGTLRFIFLDLRLGRTVLVFLVGGGLSLCGALLQGLFRNPLADPSVIGTMSGAALGAVLAFFLGWNIYLGPWGITLGALGVAAGVTFLCYRFSTVQGYTSVTGLLLSGLALNSFCAAAISFLLMQTRDYALPQIFFWLMGSFEGRTWEQVWVVLPFLIVGVGVGWAMTRSLDMFSLGELQAKALGVRVERVKQGVILTTALVAGSCASVCGVIAFVGIMVPHIVRLLFGHYHRVLLPASFLFGALFLCVCDILSRYLSRYYVFNIGILTAFIGAPYFIGLLYAYRQRVVSLS